VAAEEQHGVELSRQDGVATITLRRPEARNALTPAGMDRLGSCFDAVAENPEDRVLVLTGAGDSFCSGADLKTAGEGPHPIVEGPLARSQFARRSVAPALKLHRIPKPTLAAVNGIAAGGGCNLALGCDVLFAGESGCFSQVFVNRGLTIDYGGSWLLPRLIGLQRAKDLAFRGEVLSSREALELGLVLEVVADDALASRVHEYAQKLAEKPPIALAMIKAGLNRATSWSFEEALEYEAEAQATCLGSEDFRAAMLAWLKKTEPHFTGR
jgi:2-(1,2-epoxy-1,2-dihydrophenyl)acetyl-CoA isomerase